MTYYAASRGGAGNGTRPFTIHSRPKSQLQEWTLRLNQSYRLSRRLHPLLRAPLLRFYWPEI